MPSRSAIDFVVIGTQKGGTTSLWQYLRRHPSIAMPTIKEAPFFCFEREPSAAAIESFVAEHFGDAPPDALLGKATTHYMMGLEVGVDTIAERIARTLPGVQLMALLRDPVERAVSHYRMSVRRGLESRPLETVVEELLEPPALERARRRPTETSAYLVQGEYGRILAAYRDRFPAERLHVEYTHELEADPAAAIDRVLAFLGLPVGYRPPDLGVAYHRGGYGRLVDDRSEALLREFLCENVWPRLGADSERVRRMFDVFYEMWSVVPDDDLPRLAAATRERLEAHYRADAETLAELGVSAPWLDAWRDREGGRD